MFDRANKSKCVVCILNSIILEVRQIVIFNRDAFFGANVVRFKLLKNFFEVLLQIFETDCLNISLI